MNEKLFAVRRRHDAEERKEIIAEYERSGLTQAKFVERHQISVATLSNWLRAHREDGKQSADKAVAFAPVDMSGVLGGPVWAAEVVMPGGALLRLASVDGALTERLVKVLRRVC